MFYVAWCDLRCCRNLAASSSNPFIWLFVRHDSWYFCLGNIFNCSEESEKQNNPQTVWLLQRVIKGASINALSTAAVFLSLFCLGRILLRLPEKMREVLSAMSFAVIFPVAPARAAQWGCSAPLHLRVVKAFTAAEIPWAEVLRGCFII